MRPRPYQREAMRSITDSHARHRAVMAVLATGLGKTVIFSHLASKASGRVMIVAHRDELIRQTVEKVTAICGRAPGIEMGDECSPEARCPPVVVSSIQTLSKPKRQSRFAPSEFSDLIIDECHHAVAQSYQSTIGYFRQNPDLDVTGFTATPARSDQLAMGQVFDAVAYDYGIEKAVADGWLVQPRQRAIIVEGLNFGPLRSLAGDFSAAELERVLSVEKIIHAMAVPAIELAGDAPALVFCATVAHAHLMAEVLCRYKDKSAKALDGMSDPEDRKRVVGEFRQGRLQFLCNCGLFLEGFDAPNTAVVVMARPTKSLALYTQILGRGTRPLPGVVDPLAEATAEERRETIAASAKPSMLVIDFVGNSGRHRIVTATDLLGGKYGEPVRQYARQLTEDEPRAVGDALAQAADELAFLAEIRERKRRERIKAESVEYQARDVPVFGRSTGGGAFSAGALPSEPATEKQVKFLVWKGWKPEAARRLTKRQASGVISKLKESEGAD